MQLQLPQQQQPKEQEKRDNSITRFQFIMFINSVFTLKEKNVPDGNKIPQWMLFFVCFSFIVVTFQWFDLPY